MALIIDGIEVDEEYGFDVLRGGKVVEHFAKVENAREYAFSRGGTVRYYRKKTTNKAE